MRRSVHIVFNPAAGGASRKLVRAAAEKLRAVGMTVTVEETAGPDAAGAIARSSSADLLVAAGGDGTVREVIDGLAGSGKTLAVFPMGTANVLAAEMGLKPDVESLVGAIQAGVVRPLHLGLANGRHFAVMASIGFDSAVVAEVSPPLKKLIGKYAYVFAAIRKIVSFRPQDFALTVDGVGYRCGGVLVSNGRYYGGKFVCVPAARVTDARLHVCLLRAASRTDILRYAAALVLGRFHECAGVTVLEGRNFTIDGPAAAVQADGDIIGHTPMTITCQASQGLSVVMPA